MSKSIARSDNWYRWTPTFVVVAAALALIQIIAGLIGVRSWLVVLAPLIVAILAMSFVWPRSGIFVLALAIFLHLDIPGLTGVYPADIVSLVLIAGVCMRGLASGWTEITDNPLTIPMLICLGVFAVSLVGAYNLGIGIKNWLRHFQMFALIAGTAALLNGRDVGRIIRLLLAASFILSIPNIVTAIQEGGSQRVFGIPGAFFPFYLGTGIIYCSVGYVLGERAWHRWMWSAIAVVLTLGVVATQTREAMLQILIGLILVCGFVWVWAKRYRHAGPRRRIVWFTISCIVVLFIFLFGSLALFEVPSTRVHQALEGHSNTIHIRLFLWRTGIQTFLDSPLLGIGIGQIQKWFEIIPFWHLDPMAKFSRGIGAHNDLITYAAETGLAGLFALSLLFGVIIRAGWREWQKVDDVKSLFRLLVVWIPCLTLIIRFSFGTHTFYSLGGIFNCLFFGMLIAQVRSHQRSRIHNAVT